MNESEFEPRYDHIKSEESIYKLWEEAGYFNPDICVEKGATAPDAEPFSIILPPPNVTGELHMGHAAMLAVEDIMVRYQRMRGKRTLWVPGTDHAAIATQSKVEKMIVKEEKKNRHDLGREEFLKRVNAFAEESHDTIVRQIKRLGASLDWSREAYTLDETRSRAVRTAFKKMYGMGLIYRGNRVVNWDPKGQTVISDDEIVYEERTAKLYTFRYDKDFPIPISTTRPETKFGDTAVAVHPDDPRYKSFVGKEYDAVFCGTPIHVKIIADESVEKDFGTGALGVTPAHSAIDWEMAQRHGLRLIQVINEYAKMTVPGPVNGKKTTEAREWIVEELKKNGLLEKEEEVKQNVSTAERTGAIIEPLPKLQWFIAVNKKFKIERSSLSGIHAGQEVTLKELMRNAVESSGIKILPERFENIYFNWILNLHDWCISRQIWFGHQIPVWYNAAHNDQYVGAEAPQGDSWAQDPDTLDTWFSSGLWPFSVFSWPDETNDLKTYFPNSVLETGYDILFFWIARMILMTTCLTGEVPFRKVYLHGLVRDAKGQKMSKSKGNGIDPLEMADKYGADATRLSLIIGAAAGNDIKLSEDRIRGYRNFSTKIWNIARFIAMNAPAQAARSEAWKDALPPERRAYLSELESLKSEVTAHIDGFEFHLAAEKLYHYIWHTLADKIVEAEKENLKSGSEAQKIESYELLEHLLLESLKMLHPFMPFITEAAYQNFRPGKVLMIEKW
jgi:valyl-tRNA synthetase